MSAPAVGKLDAQDNGDKIGNKFQAPKTQLFALIIDGIFDRNLPWELVLIGVLIAVTLELSGVPSLPFAVGVYLPLASSVPITLGEGNPISARSSRVRGSVDLNPNLTADTRLVDLEGARGLGINAGSVQFSVDPNAGAARSGTLDIAGRRFTVDQDAAPPPPPLPEIAIIERPRWLSYGIVAAMAAAAGAAAILIVR